MILEPRADSDAAIAQSGLTLPEAARAEVRTGVRRLFASVARLRAAGFDDDQVDATEDAGQ